MLPRDNVRAIVTGGASGLGRGFCVEMGRRKWKVVVADIDLANAEATAAQVREAGGEAAIIRCDVSQLAEVEKLLAFGIEKFGGVDLIVNNAGVGVGGRVGEIPIEDWQWLLSINLWGVVYGCHVFVPYFRKQGTGHVINVASAAGLISSSEMAPYNMSKAAVVALSETLAGELNDTQVGITVLCPTFFQTNIAKSGRSHGDPAGFAMVNTLMEKSKLQSTDVARKAIEGALRDKLYVVPMADGRWMWRVKRLTPESFYRTLAPWVMAKVRAKFGAKTN